MLSTIAKTEHKCTHQAFLRLKTGMQQHQAMQATVGNSVQKIRHCKQCCFLHEIYWPLNIIYCPYIPETQGYIIGLFHYCMHKQLAFLMLITQKLFEPESGHLGVVNNYKELQSKTRLIPLTTQSNLQWKSL